MRLVATVCFPFFFAIFYFFFSRITVLLYSCPLKTFYICVLFLILLPFRSILFFIVFCYFLSLIEYFATILFCLCLVFVCTLVSGLGGCNFKCFICCRGLTKSYYHYNVMYPDLLSSTSQVFIISQLPTHFNSPFFKQGDRVNYL